MNADPDVHISGALDATKTAAGGWAASPSAVASIVVTRDCSSNVKVANSGDEFLNLRATITGKVAQFYFYIKCAAPRPESTIVTGLPKHDLVYIAVQCFTSTGATIGTAWLYLDGHIYTPQAFSDNGYFQATYITTD